MPGIVAVCPCRLRESELEAALQRLFPAPSLDRYGFLHRSVGGIVLGRRGHCGVFHQDDLTVVYEGTFAEISGDGVAEWIARRFQSDGADFIKAVSGSFQILIQDQDAVHLYADHVASRPIFYSVIQGVLACAPEVAPLIALGADTAVNQANALQFLLEGRFFAGHSFLRGVDQVRPGESLVWRAATLERRRHFEYEISPQVSFDEASAMPRLASLLRNAIISRWEKADRPAILMSGGYDARFIFRTVLRHVGDSSQLCTVTWGQQLDSEGSDGHIAARIAQHFRVRHLAFERRIEDALACFDEMFAAQSGMTELALTSADELALCRRLNAEFGYRSLFRGDECFGTSVATDDELEAALRVNRIGRAPRNSDICRWFTDGGDGWRLAHDEAIATLLADRPADPSALRDVLYCTERIGAFLQQLTYFKSHYLEIVAPLLDRRTIQFWATLPSALRTRKLLFRRLYNREFAQDDRFPLASRSNALDWASHIRTQPTLRSFLREHLEVLPAPLNREYFLDLLSRLGDQRLPRDHDVVSGHELVIRAVVLGQWLRRYC